MPGFRTVDVPASAYFITDAVYGCTRTFSLELSDGSAAPDYYGIDEDGQLTFDNRASTKVDD